MYNLFNKLGFLGNLFGSNDQTITPMSYNRSGQINPYQRPDMSDQLPSSLTGKQPSWFDNAVGTMGNKLGAINTSLAPLGGIKGTFNGLQNGFQILGGLYHLNNMKKGLGLARDNFNFQKSMGTKNLANQMKSYNNLLNDQLQFRAQMETGNKDAYKDQYEERKLS